MAALLLKQPNGLYARYSSIPDGFTHVEMTADEAAEMLRAEYSTSDHEIERALRAANEEWQPFSINPGPVLGRWSYVMGLIKMVHGEKAFNDSLVATGGTVDQIIDLPED
jgi:hypothetical protein